LEHPVSHLFASSDHHPSYRLTTKSTSFQILKYRSRRRQILSVPQQPSRHSIRCIQNPHQSDTLLCQDSHRDACPTSDNTTFCNALVVRFSQGCCHGIHIMSGFLRTTFMMVLGTSTSPYNVSASCRLMKVSYEVHAKRVFSIHVFPPATFKNLVRFMQRCKFKCTIFWIDFINGFRNLTPISVFLMLDPCITCHTTVLPVVRSNLLSFS
jgi:hypothetical protein